MVSLRILRSTDITQTEREFLALLIPAAATENQQSENHATFMLNFPSEVQRRLGESGR
jgi:hypothetical protein